MEFVIRPRAPAPKLRTLTILLLQKVVVNSVIGFKLWSYLYSERYTAEGVTREKYLNQ